MGGGSGQWVSFGRALSQTSKQGRGMCGTLMNNDRDMRHSEPRFLNPAAGNYFVLASEERGEKEVGKILSAEKRRESEQCHLVEKLLWSGVGKEDELKLWSDLGSHVLGHAVLWDL